MGARRAANPRNAWSIIPKSGYRFSDKIMLQHKRCVAPPPGRRAAQASRKPRIASRRPGFSFVLAASINVLRQL